MPIVDQNRLIGNEGVAVVATVLSPKCLVRPVSADTDVGIDLYCETLEQITEAERRPFLHFWVQVKAGLQCRVLGNGEQASCSFDRDHLDLWMRQPVPVCAALVPPEEEHTQRSIYIVDLTNHLIDHGLPDTGERTIRSVLRIQTDDEAALAELVDGWVPYTTSRVRSAQIGAIIPLPTYHPRYSKQVPYIPFRRYGDQVYSQVRVTASLAVLNMYNDRLLIADHQTRWEQFAHISAELDNEHWESHMAQGLALHASGRYDEAAAKYEDARQSILNDKTVANDPDWQPRFQFIDELVTRARDQLHPHP